MCFFFFGVNREYPVTSKWLLGIHCWSIDDHGCNHVAATSISSQARQSLHCMEEVTYKTKTPDVSCLFELWLVSVYFRILFPLVSTCLYVHPLQGRRLDSASWRSIEAALTTQVAGVESGVESASHIPCSVLVAPLG